MRLTRVHITSSVEFLIRGTPMKAMPPTGWHKRIRPPHLSMHLPDQEADHSMPIGSMLRPCRLITHGHIDTPSLMMHQQRHATHCILSMQHRKVCYQSLIDMDFLYYSLPRGDL